MDKRKHNFTTNANEMQFFIAKLLLTDYKQLPQRKVYWENSSDVLNTVMSRNLFE